MINVIKKLASVQGVVSIDGGQAVLEDGTVFDLVNAPKQRYVALIEGGTYAAGFTDSSNLDIRIIDFDDLKDNPDADVSVPSSWSDLAQGIPGISVDTTALPMSSNVHELLDQLKDVQGNVSIRNGMAQFEDGTTLDLNAVQSPRVLVTISGGVAEMFSDDSSVDVKILDADNIAAGDPSTVPASWVDLFPRDFSIPLMDDSASSKVPKPRM